MSPSPAEYRATVAALVDRFGLAPADVGRLTSRQIAEVYGHHRDREGAVTIPLRQEAIPERRGSLEEELTNIDLLASLFHWPLEEVMKLKDQLRVKYAVRTNGLGGADVGLR